MQVPLSTFEDLIEMVNYEVKSKEYVPFVL